jgi:hypothetical protein
MHFRGQMLLHRRLLLIAATWLTSFRCTVTPGKFSGGRMQAHAIRQSFPELWAQYLRATFASPGAVSRAFPGVDEKTCRDWWAGKRNPSGCFVAAVVASDPAAIEILGRVG